MTMFLSESTVLPVQGYQQPVSITKKISNYIFCFNDKIGQGNFSKVYKGFHQLTNQQVAIKIIELSSLKSAKLQQLLFSEIQVIQSLNHPNILRCYEVLKSEHNCYIITELCNGGDLQSVLKKQKCLNQITAAPYIRDIFNGLLYLGERGIVHRDLKIANIFLHNGNCKIADFGFAKYTNNQNFLDLDIGSPLYMSPEGMIDHMYGMKTDIWAFGIIFFQLLHGKTPYSYCTSEYELKRAVMTPLSFNSLRPDMSHQAKQLILKCLIVDSKNRPDAISLKQDVFIQHLMNFNSNRKNIIHLDTHSMQAIPHNVNEFRKLETASSSSSQKINQQMYVANQFNFHEQAVYNPNFLAPLNLQMRQQKDQSPGQYDNNSPNRSVYSARTIQRQQLTKETFKKQQLNVTQQSLNKIDVSPQRSSHYSNSYGNIQFPQSNDIIQMHYPTHNQEPDRILVPDEQLLKSKSINKVISKNQSTFNKTNQQPKSKFNTQSYDNFDKLSSSSWYQQTLPKKKLTKTLSYQNVNILHNNLNSNNYIPSRFNQNPNITQTTNAKSFFQLNKTSKNQEKSNHTLPNSNVEIKLHQVSPIKNPQKNMQSSFKEDNNKSFKKFGQIIKGQKKPDVNVKSVIKLQKGSQSQANLLVDKSKTNSRIEINQDLILETTESPQVNRKNWRHSYGDMSPLFGTQFLNQSIRTSVNHPVQLPIFIQQKQRMRQQIKKNLICSIIEFKQAVGFLHYCRLYYRFVSTLKKILWIVEAEKCDFLAHFFKNSEDIIEVYSRFLLTALSELMENIRCKEILYDGDNYKKKKMKEDKLKQVSEEYFKKYMEEINKARTTHQKITPHYTQSTSMSFMKEHNEQLWESVDQEWENLIQISRKTEQVSENLMKHFRNLCYFSIKIIEANEIITNCISLKNYKSLADTMIENWLGQEFYGDDVYLRLKDQYLKKTHEANALRNSETNDTQTEIASRVNKL